MYIDSMEETTLETVDLKFKLFTDEEGGALYIKFQGFDNERQLKQFADYITDHLPLLLYNSGTAH
jgi:hypothetical protein